MASGEWVGQRCIKRIVLYQWKVSILCYFKQRCAILQLQTGVLNLNRGFAIVQLLSFVDIRHMWREAALIPHFKAIFGITLYFRGNKAVINCLKRAILFCWSRGKAIHMNLIVTKITFGPLFDTLLTPIPSVLHIIEWAHKSWVPQFFLFCAWLAIGLIHNFF